MKPSNFHNAIHKANKQIAILNRHLQCVQSTGMTRHIENEISKQQTSIRLMIRKDIDQLRQAPRKTLDNDNRKALK